MSDVLQQDTNTTHIGQNLHINIRTQNLQCALYAEDVTVS